MNGITDSHDAIAGGSSGFDTSSNFNPHDGDAPAPSTSKVRLEEMMETADDHALLGSAGDGPIEAVDEEPTARAEQQFPESLQEYYWDCLYCSSKPSKNQAAIRLVQAFKVDHYKTTTLHADGTQEIHQSYRDTLSSLLFTKLGKLDEKFHVDLPAIVNDWTRQHDLLENGIDDEIEGKNTRQDEETISAEALEKANAGIDAQELEYLEKAWKGWLKSANDNDGERVVSAEERRNRMKSTIRERLSALETAELQLQILVALELLTVLPIPSYLTARNAHHRRLHSASGSHSQNWLSILRNGTPQRASSNGNASRKRKKNASASNTSTNIAGPVTSSNLTTPRQSSLFNPSHLSHFDTITEDQEQQHDDASLLRQELERSFKDTARLLDSQTDNLAIQQTVANAIGGLSLADLMGDIASSGDRGKNSDEKGKGKEEELDVFQSFWLDVVEEHYATRLPSDILSGCHSKFFSNSLDPSLGHATHSASVPHPHPSPFHHPTPDLRQLALSVQLANLQAEKNAIPQSPTLVKLLAAKDEPRQYDGIDEEDPGGGDDIGWLMPAPAPAALSANDRKTNFLQQSSLKQTLKRTSSSNSAFVTANLNHRTRVVEFGKVKEVKEKRDEINARKMRQSNGLKPFSSSSSLINAHAQAQSQNESQEKRGHGSVMAKSLGARNNSLPPQSGSEEGKLSSTTLSQANGRISKRKAASPKKTALPDGKGSKGRTLVLATPVKIRTKSSSSSTLIWDNKPTSMAQMPELGSGDQRQLQGKRGFSKSKSLPAFVWGDPESGRGINEVDEEEMDRGLGADSDEDDRELLRPADGKLLLVGETPQKL